MFHKLKSAPYIKQGIADLVELAQKTDKKLVLYLQEMMNNRNIAKCNSDINKDEQRIKSLQKQIDNAKNNPHTPYEQINELVKEIQKCKNDIDFKKIKIDKLTNDNKIIEAGKKGACPEQIDAMTHSFEQENNKKLKDFQAHQLKQVQAPKAKDNAVNNLKTEIQHQTERMNQVKDMGSDIAAHEMKKNIDKIFNEYYNLLYKPDNVEIQKPDVINNINK